MWVACCTNERREILFLLYTLAIWQRITVAISDNDHPTVVDKQNSLTSTSTSYNMCCTAVLEWSILVL